MIVDGFMFFNELELLEIRLHELADVVDRFVLVEARETFSLQPKPLHFYENRSRFSDFLSRIDHRVIDRFPDRTSPWAAEIYQRNYLSSAFADCAPDDILVYSDLDEIPAAAAFFPEIAADGPVALEQQQYYIYLNCRFVSDPLRKAKVFRRRDLERLPTLQQLRQMQHPVVPNGGWHFSSLGGLDGAANISYKLSAYAHQELNRARYKSEKNYRRALAAGRLYFSSKHRIEWVPLDSSFPAYVLQNRAKFEHLIAPPNTIGTSRWAEVSLSFTHTLERAKDKLARETQKLARVWKEWAP
jgi:hypothetical protein